MWHFTCFLLHCSFCVKRILLHSSICVTLFVSVTLYFCVLLNCGTLFIYVTMYFVTLLILWYIVHFVLNYSLCVTLLVLCYINCFYIIMQVIWPDSFSVCVCVCIFRGEFFLYQLDKEGHPAVVERRKWDRRDFHYDNVASAMLTLFAVQTGEGWPLWVANCCCINISMVTL